MKRTGLTNYSKLLERIFQLSDIQRGPKAGKHYWVLTDLSISCTTVFGNGLVDACSNVGTSRLAHPLLMYSSFSAVILLTFVKVNLWMFMYPFYLEVTIFVRLWSVISYSARFIYSEIKSSGWLIAAEFTKTFFHNLNSFLQKKHSV